MKRIATVKVWLFWKREDDTKILYYCTIITPWDIRANTVCLFGLKPSRVIGSRLIDTGTIGLQRGQFTLRLYKLIYKLIYKLMYKLMRYYNIHFVSSFMVEMALLHHEWPTEKEQLFSYSNEALFRDTKLCVTHSLWFDCSSLIVLYFSVQPWRLQLNAISWTFNK